MFSKIISRKKIYLRPKYFIYLGGEPQNIEKIIILYLFIYFLSYLTSQR